jgi:hypothetical protein
MQAPNDFGTFTCQDCNNLVDYLLRVNPKGVAGIFVCKKCAKKYDTYKEDKDLNKLLNIIAND